MSDTNNSGVCVRRATSGDYDDIVAIHENVYEGDDYLPTTYEQWLDGQSYAAYVAQIGDQLVSFILFGLNYSDNQSSIMAMRVKPEFQGRGLTRLIRQQFLKDFPNITHFVFTGFLTPTTAVKLSKCRTLSKWNTLAYHVNGKLLCNWFESTQHPALLGTSAGDGRKDLLLSAEDCQVFASNGQFHKLLSRYATDLIPMGNASWEPVEFSRGNRFVNELAKLRTFLTLDEQHQQRSETVSREPLAMSYCGVCPLKTKTRSGEFVADIIFYGEDINTLLRHVLCHLRHLAAETRIVDDNGKPTGECADLGIYLSFPLTMNMELVDSLIRQRSEQQLLITTNSKSIGLEFMELSESNESYLALEKAIR